MIFRLLSILEDLIIHYFNYNKLLIIIYIYFNINNVIK